MYLECGFTGLRRGIDGLARIIRFQFQLLFGIDIEFLEAFCLVILLKKLSIMFNHEPCFGVNTNLKRPFGIVSRKRRVSLEVCAE